jgi:alkyl sulfatase BDS1-like metallo-beta-lactamase superfamily hydrolase
VHKPDLTLTINRADLEQTMMGAKTLEAQIADGTAKVSGDVNVLKKLASTMIEFDPRFQIMPGTKSLAANVPKIDPYKVEVGEPPPE